MRKKARRRSRQGIRDKKQLSSKGKPPEPVKRWRKVNHQDVWF